MGRRKRASQIGRGRRIVSTKQEVGIGEEMWEDGPCGDCQLDACDNYMRRIHGIKVDG